MNICAFRNKCQCAIWAAQAGRGRWQPPSFRGLRPRSQWVSTAPIPHQGETQPELQSPPRMPTHENSIGRYSWSLLEWNPNGADNHFWKFIQANKVLGTDANGRIPLVILLLTPAHIKYLDDQDPFLPELLSWIFTMSKEPQVDLVAAVVDQIPYPPNSYPVPNLKHWRQGPKGCEGFSVAVLDSDIAAPDLWSQDNVQKSPGLESPLQHSVLSFRFPSNESSVDSGTAPQHTESTTSRVVQLPVANTSFHNNQPSTMFATRWVASMNSKSQKVYECVKKMRLARQTLNMTGMFSHEDMKHRSQLFLELQPLTVPRIIAAGLGNIVRELFISRESNETMPASQELEHAISREVQTLENPNQGPEVWALITPRTKWIDEPQIGTSDAAHWIERGSRLHRILSGGGGWGPKKGLLALDPETDFDSPDPKTDQAWENGQVTDETPGQTLGGIFKPGDIITFFRSRFFRSRRPEIKSDSAPPYLHIRSPTSVCFGSVPPTADSIRNQSTVIPPFQKILVKGYFGMLSEQGMNFHVESEVSADSMEQSGTVVHTKITDPYGHFSITGRRRSEIDATHADGRKVMWRKIKLQKQLFRPAKHPAPAAQSIQNARSRFKTQSIRHASSRLKTQSIQHASSRLKTQSVQHASSRFKTQPIQHASSRFKTQSIQHARSRFKTQPIQHASSRFKTQSTQHASSRFKTSRFHRD